MLSFTKVSVACVNQLLRMTVERQLSGGERGAQACQVCATIILLSEGERAAQARSQVCATSMFMSSCCDDLMQQHGG